MELGAPRYGQRVLKVEPQQDDAMDADLGIAIEKPVPLPSAQGQGSASSGGAAASKVPPPTIPSA